MFPFTRANKLNEKDQLRLLKSINYIHKISTISTKEKEIPQKHCNCVCGIVPSKGECSKKWLAHISLQPNTTKKIDVT